MVLVRVSGQSIHVGGPGVAFTGTQYKGAERRLQLEPSLRCAEQMASIPRPVQRAQRSAIMHDPLTLSLWLADISTELVFDLEMIRVLQGSSCRGVEMHIYCIAIIHLDCIAPF